LTFEDSCKSLSGFNSSNKIDEMLINLYWGFPKLLSDIDISEEIVTLVINNLEKYLSSEAPSPDKDINRHILITTLADILKSARYSYGNALVLVKNKKYASVISKLCLYCGTKNKIKT